MEQLDQFYRINVAPRHKRKVKRNIMQMNIDSIADDNMRRRHEEGKRMRVAYPSGDSFEPGIDTMGEGTIELRGTGQRFRAPPGMLASRMEGK